MRLGRTDDVRLKRSGRFTFYMIIIVFGLLASARLWGPGMVNTRGGGDSPFLLQRTLDMAENLRHGIFPPRWMAHAAYDLGYPFFNHYASLPYYLSGGLTALGISPLVAIQTTQTFGFVLAALTMALWIQNIYRASGARGRSVLSGWFITALAVVAYTFAPFHLVNVYVRGDSLSEFYAQVWYPLILWALGRLIAAVDTNPSPSKRSIWGRVIVAALAYAALILTHNASAMIFSPFAILYVLLLDLKFVGPIVGPIIGSMFHGGGDRTRSSILNHLKAVIMHWGVLLSPFVLGILLTTWFWLPAVAETGYGQMGEAFTAGYFHYSKHFRGTNLVQPSLLFNYNTALRAEEAGPFTMGLGQAIATTLGIVALIGVLVQTRKRQRPLSRQRQSPGAIKGSSPIPSPEHALFLLLGLLIATLMITPLSRPLWDHLPLLEITQFPWRFLSVQALFTSALIAALGLYPREGFNVHHSSLTILFSVCVAGVLIASTMLSLHPDRLLITDKDVTWDMLLLYESFTGNIGTTIRYEYLPRDVVPRLYISESVVDGELPQPVALDGTLGAEIDGSGGLSANLLRRTPVKQVWQVILTQDASVVFPLNWWPGWRAIVDGQRMETRPVMGSGRLTVDLTAGTHTVILRLRDTPLRLVAEVISALALLGCLIVSVVLGLGKVRRNDLGRQCHPRGETMLVLGALTTAGALLLSLLLCLFFNRISSPNLSATRAYAFDFLQMPYPHAGPLDFLDSASGLGSGSGLGSASDKVVKLWFEPLFIQAEPGEVVRIPLRAGKLYTLAPLTATVRLVSPAAPRHGVSYILAEMSFDLGCIGNLGAEDPVTPPELDSASGHCAALDLQLPPSDLARGLYLVEFRVYGNTESGLREYFAHTPQGHAMGPVYIGAIRVPSGPSRPADIPIKAVFEDSGGVDVSDADRGESFILHTVEADQVDPTALRLKMTWSTYTPMARNWSLSLRLLDATGRLITQQDLQPGYGYLPTTLWKPGELVTDYPELSLPEGLAPGEYILRIVAYLQATMEGGGEADAFVTLPRATLRDPQDVYCECVDRDSKSLCKAAGVSLVNVDLPEKIAEGSPLDCYVAWYAEAKPSANLSARWEVMDANGSTVAVTSGPLSPGSQTLSWPSHAWVRAPLHVDLPHTLPDRPYQLRVTLLSQGEQPGSQKPIATCNLATSLPIAARARLFDAPSPLYAQIAVFRDRTHDIPVLRLLGYDLAPGQEIRTVNHQRETMAEVSATADALSLTLWWQAAADPPQDYKRFVHLFNPDTEQILAQDDAMPRSWTYPTGWWVVGEVVSETVTLDLSVVPPGPYRLAVGWYDPETVGEGFESARLLALDANGDPLSMNRVVLNTPVIRK